MLILYVLTLMDGDLNNKKVQTQTIKLLKFNVAKELTGKRTRKEEDLYSITKDVYSVNVSDIIFEYTFCLFFYFFAS